MTILKLRMLSGENDDFVRDYEISADSTLLDLHDLICGDLGYDPANMASFFSCDENWEKTAEFTLVDMGADDAHGAPSAMEDVKAGQVLQFTNDRLLYLFDPFADRCLFIELTGAKSADDISGYPRVAFSAGEAPPQFDPSFEPEEELSIFDDAMGDFSDFDGDDNIDDSY